MDCTATRIPYRQTNAFSTIALDYIDQAAALKPFYAHPPSLQGIQKAIASRKPFPVKRKVLVEELKKQYRAVNPGKKVDENIEALLSENTFTVTTAHQNNIFTGPLYFIYKIIHAIRLADHLNDSLEGNRFVPVFYIGSEDADLDELNHIYLDGEKLGWQTGQTGAVGRMKTDKELLRLVDRIEGRLGVLPHGAGISSLIRDCYREGRTIQDATFIFVHALFAEYGLVVLLPDNAALKTQVTAIFEDDLLHQAASGIVEETTSRLQSAGYKVQAHPREINLFYLTDNSRERLVEKNGSYVVLNSQVKFTREQLLEELRAHPERFSPNVILRGLYQESILPNIAFIGGAGETAYWLQLKDLFDHYRVPFPVLVLRNSFLVVERKWREKMTKLGFRTEDFFLPGGELMNRLVKRESRNETRLNGSLGELEQLYDSFRTQAAKVDATLEKHVEALKSRTVQRLQELEKKMLRAEKRKYSDQQRQLHAIREALFPGNGLQERTQNFSYYYALYGPSFIRSLYDQALTLEQEFVILEL